MAAEPRGRVVVVVTGDLPTQPSLRRMIAYSSIAHAGYLLIGRDAGGLGPRVAVEVDVVDLQDPLDAAVAPAFLPVGPGEVVDVVGGGGSLSDGTQSSRRWISRY